MALSLPKTIYLRTYDPSRYVQLERGMPLSVSPNNVCLKIVAILSDSKERHGLLKLDE